MHINLKAVIFVCQLNFYLNNHVSNFLSFLFHSIFQVHNPIFFITVNNLLKKAKVSGNVMMGKENNVGEHKDSDNAW